MPELSDMRLSTAKATFSVVIEAIMPLRKSRSLSHISCPQRPIDICGPGLLPSVNLQKFLLDHIPCRAFPEFKTYSSVSFF